MARIITTERLRLRSPRYSDLNEMVEMDQEQEVQQYLFVSAQTSVALSEQVSLRKRLKESIKSGDPKGGAVWTIEDKKTGYFIGMISLELSPAINKMALSFRLKPKIWLQGYATEAAKAAIEFAFNKLMFSELSALVHPDNIASQRVVEKCGFHRDGLLFVGPKTAIDFSPTPNQNTSANPHASISYNIFTLFR